MIKYIAFLFRDIEINDKYKDTGFNVIIPDVDGAYTCGDDLEHSLKMGKNVLKFALEDLDEYPQANKLEYFTENKLKELDIPITAIYQTIQIKPKVKKKTVTIKLSLQGKKIIDNYVASNNITR